MIASEELFPVTYLCKSFQCHWIPRSDIDPISKEYDSRVAVLRARGYDDVIEEMERCSAKN